MKQLNNFKINTDWLFFLRISIGLIAFVSFISIQSDFENIYSFNGFVKPDIMDAAFDTYSFTMIDIYEYLTNNIKLNIKYENILLFFRFFYPLTLILLIFGLFTRPIAILALISQVILIKSIHYYQYGFDFFNTILLFYCIIFPVGKVKSLDNIIFKRKIKLFETKKYLSLIQIHICIVYFFGGFGKIIGITWINGEAIYKALTVYNNLQIISFDFITEKWVFIILGWSILILELLYPIFINIKKTRNIWLFGIIGMHIMITLVMGLFFFSAIMIAFNLLAYYIPYLKDESNSSKKTINQPELSLS